MGRKYNGMDYQKVTVKLDKRQFDIVRQYGFKLQKEVFDEQDRTGKVKPYHWKMSDSIRAGLDLLGIQNQLSDNMETSAANLVDIAKVFDSIDGPNAKVYAQAIREAAALIMLFCYNSSCKIEDGKIILQSISRTKSKPDGYTETTIEITGKDAPLPLGDNTGGTREK